MPRPSRRQHLESVLFMLQERDNSRRQELEEYPRVAKESERTASQSPIYDGFVVVTPSFASQTLRHVS
ncbi:hypothetical protein PC129_g22462 [Phytophthora cactorum]|uniref:Uncharacterized protein n=1 Tax=Phytophthora cactorum TaxID=29920 RepID=A0A8T1H2W0_9STRA|nr:hypothetical protein PC114_g25616 [Phytophthora cactorum]KAG3139209.1 hypothetical protein PC128_g25401 [Phytophthora cactorum]KAG3204692.1 hypothetical protein PC129_g22462 [Phytophthora cactorum]